MKVVVIRSLAKHAVEADPSLIWNTYVNLLATEKYQHLSPEQRPAKLVFWYESEVQNGGHLQYFENRGTGEADETILALGRIEAPCQQQVLREALAAWLSRSRPRIQTAEEYCEIAMEWEFESFDSRFHACAPSLIECLERYLNIHQNLFIQVT